jgi:diguanylate cyclase (GGDEF)-like protein
MTSYESISNRDTARRLALKLIFSIAFTELGIMLGFKIFKVVDWLPPFFIDLLDAVLLSLLASLLIFFWVVNPLKIFEERRKNQEQVRHLAYYDTLTGLPNRYFFKELLNNNLEHARRYGGQFAIVFIDLDNFNRINDSLGHDLGDQLLQAAAARLIKSVRNSDYIARVTDEEITDVARLGGDEFLVFLHDLSDPNNAARVARRILEGIAAPYELEGREIFITASLGIATYPADGENADDLFKHADTAMYHAKGKGKNNYQYYSSSMNVSSLEMLNMENNLHKALEREELLLYYQPKLDLKTRTICGMEALIRWQRPGEGLIQPGKFIPLAEACGLIVPIGEFVLKEACRQNRLWQETGLLALGVAVNLSCRQFGQKKLLAEIFQTIRDSGLDPCHLELEVTESTIMQNPDKAINVLQELRSAGLQIAIDDFGTGYSSLSYLRRLPLSSLKIDISFIRNMLTNQSDAVIVRTIIAMAHSLNLKVIAEGVETEEQLAFLKEHGCDVIQGYLVSKPVPAEEFAKFLQPGRFF